MEFLPYLSRLRECAWVLVLGTLVAAGVGYMVARQLPPVYESSATLMVNVAPAGALPSLNDVTLSQQLVKTYAALALQPVVLERAANQLGYTLTPDDLQRMVSAQQVRDTQLLTLDVKSPNADQAQQIANTLASVFIDAQHEWFPSGNGAISVVQPALLPATPVEPRVPVIVALAAGVGLLLMLGGVLAWDVFDDRIQTAAELDFATALPTVGTVMQLSRRTGVQEPTRLLSPLLISSPADEAYGLLGTKLDLVSLEKPWKVLLITSALPGEGKSMTAANLALALAKSGRRVVIVDANLRRPVLHHLFGLRNVVGLSDLLSANGSRASGAVQLKLQAGPVPRLQVLTAGVPTPRPAELLQSSAFLLLLEQLARDADAVLLDSPPALGGADALVLAQAVEATLLVVDTRTASSTAVREATAALRQTETHLLGAVLNRVRPRFTAQSAA